MIPEARRKVKYIDSEGWNTAMIYESTPAPVIPEAAVEAAARQLFTQDSGEAVWGEVREAIRMHYRAEVTAALEAAAPHMTCTHDNT